MNVTIVAVLAKVARVSLMLLSLFVSLALLAGNKTLVIDGTNAAIEGNTMTISYDLNLTSNTTAEVRMAVSANNGASYDITAQGATGHIGMGITAGKNKQIQWQVPAALAGKALKVKLTANELANVEMTKVVDDVSAENIEKYLLDVLGERHPMSEEGIKHLNAVRDYIEDFYKEHGLTTSRQVFDFGDDTGQNIIGKIKGSNPNEIMILSAHYDAYPGSPGAAANGSGVAAMLEAVRVLSKYSFEKTIVFVGFDMSNAQFQGANWYVFRGGVQEDEKVIGDINLDCVGHYYDFPNAQYVPKEMFDLFPEAAKAIEANEFRGDFAINVANEASAELSQTFQANASKFVPELKLITLTVPGNGGTNFLLTDSDHVAFWYNNNPALEIMDGGLSRDQKNNSKEDLPEHLTYEFTANITKASIATVADIAGIQGTSTVIDVKVNK